MKSRLIKAADFAAIELPSTDIELTEEAMAGEIDLHIRTDRLSHRTYAEASAVENGSIVTADFSVNDSSDTSETLIINAGAGLFDAASEQAMFGKTVGDSLPADTPRGKGRLTIRKIEKRIVPEPDDAFVKLLGIDGVETMDAYRAYLRQYYIDFYIDNYLIYFAMQAFESFMQASEWHYDEEETESLYREYRSMCERCLAAHDTYIEGTEEELDEMYRTEFTQYFSQYLFLCSRGEADQDLHFTTGNELSSMSERALAPFRALLQDRVKIVWVEEEQNGD